MFLSLFKFLSSLFVVSAKRKILNITFLVPSETQALPFLRAVGFYEPEADFEALLSDPEAGLETEPEAGHSEFGCYLAHKHRGGKEVFLLYLDPIC